MRTAPHRHAHPGSHLSPLDRLHATVTYPFIPPFQMTRALSFSRKSRPVKAAPQPSLDGALRPAASTSPMKRVFSFGRGKAAAGSPSASPDAFYGAQYNASGDHPWLGAGVPASESTLSEYSNASTVTSSIPQSSRKAPAKPPPAGAPPSSRNPAGYPPLPESSRAAAPPPQNFTFASSRAGMADKNQIPAPVLEWDAKPRIPSSNLPVPGPKCNGSPGILSPPLAHHQSSYVARAPPPTEAAPRGTRLSDTPAYIPPLAIGKPKGRGPLSSAHPSEAAATANAPPSFNDEDPGGLTKQRSRGIVDQATGMQTQLSSWHARQAEMAKAISDFSV